MSESTVRTSRNGLSLGGFALQRLGQQIWAAGMANGSLYLGINTKPHPERTKIEGYWVIPSARNPKFLVPDASANLSARALSSYRGLRSGTANAARLALGLLACVGLPLSRDRLTIQLCAGTVNTSPVKILQKELGLAEVYAATGVRLGLNAKPTLHLFDGRGKPVGFAKLAWNKPSTTLVENEIRVLGELAGGSSILRVPGILSQGTIHGRKYLVTEPLPSSVRGLTVKDPAPTPEELYAIAPITGRSKLSDLDFYRGLHAQLSALIAGDRGSTLCSAVQLLTSRISSLDHELPVVARWHGDLVPWNCARDGAGTLWCWDLETCDDSPAAGLDILHWNFNVQRRRDAKGAVLDFEHAINASRLHLRSLGLDDAAVSLASAVYVLKLVERAWTLARAGSGWDRSWISERELRELVYAAGDRLAVLIGS